MAFYKQKKTTFIRLYDEFGYIKSTTSYCDQVFDKSGMLFLKHISREPKDLSNIADEIVKEFIDVTKEDIIDDVREFFDNLVEDSFLVKGDTIELLEMNDVAFSYDSIINYTTKEDYTPIIKRSDEDSQVVLNDIFLNNPYLLSFQIELTSKCNERCIHCYIPHEFKDTDIKDELFYSVLKQLREMNALNLTLSGGEPLAHPHFKDYLKASLDSDFSVIILTNLTLLDDEIIQIVKQNPNCSFQTSLYSMNPEHHDAITKVKGSFEKTKDAIEKLIANNIQVQISCPMMSVNKDDFVDVIKWAHSHKIRAYTDISIMAKYNHDTSNLANRLTVKECEKVILSLLEYDTDYQETILEPDFEIRCNTINEDPNERFCGVGFTSCCMVSNGNVYPCSGWQGFVCGNLYKNTLEDIWNNSKEMNYLRKLRKGDIKECLNCEHKAFCSPCLSRFANESPTGNPLEVAHHFCEVAKINKKLVLEWRRKKLNQK